MSQLSSLEPTILERPYMLYRPFGKDVTGEPINDMTGVSIRENVKYLEEFVSRNRGPEAGKLATKELVLRLNQRIPEPAYYVTPEFLASGSTGYSNEFVAYLVEFCVELSQDPEFQKHVGERLIPDWLIRIMRFFSIRQIYNSADIWVGFYNKSSYLLEKVHITSHSVTIRLRLTERTEQQFGAYRRACGRIWCNAIKYGIASVPTRVYDLAPAKIEERSCLAHGQEFCEWRFAWEEPRRTWNPAKHLARWILQREIEEQKESFQQQYDQLNKANVELQESKAKLEESAAALERRVEELTTLHEAGVAFTSARDYETWVQKALQAIINILHYDRALLNRYDPRRQVLYDAKVMNVSEEIATFARALEIPVTDPSSIEGQVLLQQKPLLLDNIHREFHRLHPFHQQLVSLTGSKSFISVPLVGKDGVLGSLTVDRKEENSLTENDLNLMITLANQLALALENVDAYQEIEALNVGLEAKVQTRTAELEAVNDRLKELDRLKTEFFNNLSHELRTPLTLSMGAFRSLFKESSLSTEARRLAVTGYENSKILLDLINDLLKLAKLDSGQLKLHKQCFDLKRFVVSIASNFESSVKNRIHIQHMTESVPIEADSRQLKAVFYNLFSNGLKFSDPQEGQVWVTLHLKDDHVFAEVQDNGIGIPQDHTERIFERFTQVEGSANRRYEGTGIGLALVKEIVTLHGGQITVHSKPSYGSTFTVILPRGVAREDNLVNIDDESQQGIFQAAAVTTPESSCVVPCLQPDKNRPLLIIAEDNFDMRNYLERVLSSQYRVECAKNGWEAFEKAKRTKPDLILTDVMMPKMSGHDLLKSIRSEKLLCNTPVIFLTARVGEEERLEGLEKGADDYITKPFNEQEVLARVRNLIRARTLERELRELREQRLTRFLPRHLAELVLEGNADEFLKGHRRDITVMFIDLRGFTAYAEIAEPEELQNELRRYQIEMGKLISEFQGTLERFTGDSIMLFFNDPLPIPNHIEQALKLALAMRERMKKLCWDWKKREIPLGAGIGIATGFATLGLMGYEERVDYAAIGPMTNLAARLCAEAKNGQILIPQSLIHKVGKPLITESLGNLSLKGILRPVTVYNLIGLQTNSGNLDDSSLKESSPMPIL